MSCPRCVDSVGIRILGLKWHSRQANDAVASERSIFSENNDYKRFFRVAVNTYVPIFRGLNARGSRKLQKDTHTHIHVHIVHLEGPCAFVQTQDASGRFFHPRTGRTNI